jgi:hypothetical protein
MPSIQADHRNHRSQRSQRGQCMDALLGTAWAWDEDDEPEGGAGPAGCEHERDPGPPGH